MSTKKIAIVTSTFPPYRGGMGRVAQLDAEQLSAAGFDVHVYTVKQGREERPPASGYSVHELAGMPRIGNAAFVPQLRRLRSEYPLTLLHYPFFGGAEPLLFGAGEGKVAMVYHMDVVGGGLKAAVFRLHRKLLLPELVRRSNAVIVTSEDYAVHSYIADFVAEYPERVHVLPPSVDTQHFADAQGIAETCSRITTREGMVSVGIVGGLDTAHYFKGLEPLMRAVARPALDHYELVVVGDGDRRAYFEELAESLGIRNRVRFTGSVSDEELPHILRCADVFAFPSLDKSEAFGIAALEALSCGLPVVASDLPGVRTIVRDGETGLLVPTNNVKALADALISIVSDTARYKAMATYARTMAVQEYDHTVRAAQLENIVRGLL